MAEVAITEASVLSSSAAVMKDGIAGAAITTGQVVYKDTTTNTWKLASAANAATSRDVMTHFGISLNRAASGQPIKICVADTAFVPGGTLVAGTIYVLTDTAGAIGVLGDIDTGADSIVILGIASSTTVLRFTPIYGTVNWVS